MSKHRLPSPALVIASIALLVALTGTAVGGVGIVPLAKRALTADKAKVALVANQAKTAAVADKAKTLESSTANTLMQQAAAAPSPASTAAGLVVVKTANWTLNPGTETNFTVMCDAGQKAIGGGWTDPGDWSQHYQSLPTADGGGWVTLIYTSSAAPGQQSGTLYAICLK